MIFEYMDMGQIRVTEKDGQPWFVAKDVCDILGIANPSDAMNMLESDEKFTLGISEGKNLGFKHTNAGINIINESGLYTIILRSNKPEARIFRKWVTSEVLPAIRKHGGYILERDDWKTLRSYASYMYLTQNEVVMDIVKPYRPTKHQEMAMQMDEADLLNVAVFGRTAAEFRKQNPDKAKGGKNQRDYATEEQLLVLTVVEAVNAVCIRAGVPLVERYYCITDFARSYFAILKVKRGEIPPEIENLPLYVVGILISIFCRRNFRRQNI